MLNQSSKELLYERVFVGFLEEKRLPTDDKGIFVMLRGLDIVEIQIGPFADFNISIEEKEKMGMTNEMFEKVLRDVAFKRENLIRYWKILATDYICETKGFQKKSSEYQEWFDEIGEEYSNHLEWTIEMYEWGMKFLEILKFKLILDIISNNVIDKK